VRRMVWRAAFWADFVLAMNEIPSGRRRAPQSSENA